MDAGPEPDGFVDYVRARQRGLLQLAWLLTGDWPAAEDLLQTALLAVLPRWSRIRSPDAVDAYVRRVVMTTFLAGRRRRWNDERPWAEPPEPTAAPDPTDRVGDRDLLVDALRTLPPGQRAVVVLRHVMDFSEADTAAALNCSVGSVKTQNSRALTALRRTLGSPDPHLEVT